MQCILSHALSNMKLKWSDLEASLSESMHPFKEKRREKNDAEVDSFAPVLKAVAKLPDHQHAASIYLLARPSNRTWQEGCDRLGPWAMVLALALALGQWVSRDLFS